MKLINKCPNCKTESDSVSDDWRIMNDKVFCKKCQHEAEPSYIVFNGMRFAYAGEKI